MKNKNILVVGGCGKKEHTLVNKLNQENNMFVYDNLKTGNIFSVDENVSVYEEDIRNTKRFKEVLKLEEIDWVIDLISTKYKISHKVYR